MSNMDEIILCLIERAVEDPDFWLRLAEDPMGAAQDEGLDLPVDALRSFLDMHGATDEEVVEELKDRVMRSRILI